MNPQKTLSYEPWAIDVKIRLLEMNMLERELAKRVGVHLSTLSRVLTGKEARPEVKRQVCAILGIKAEPAYAEKQ
jgi:predicted transcriptional regulator